MQKNSPSESSLLISKTAAASGQPPEKKRPLSIAEALGVPPLPVLPDPDRPVAAWYDSGRKEYLLQNSGGRWLSHAEGSFKRLLRSHGYTPVLSKEERDAGETISELERELLRIQDCQDVHYCGPLAGREAGFYEENGIRLLVTESPRLPEPRPGPCVLIPAILRSLVAGKGETCGDEQYPRLLGWLAAAVESLYTRFRRPGQALVLAGPAGAGKSVVQNKIITPLLGGRSAKCAPYLQGRTNFNGELFGAEHLMLEDESSDICIKSRLALASHIKQICVNEVQPCHSKNRPIVNLAPFWRLTLSLNDEPERLLIIPPLTADVEDKLLIFRCMPVQWPQPAGIPLDWESLMAAVEEELPAFLHFLLAHKVPPALHSARYGVRSWHHPDLLQAIDDLSPEAHLAQLILRWIDGPAWRGTSDRLRTELLNFDDTQRDARDLLRWPNACGTYLARLAKNPRPPLAVQPQRSGTERAWVVSVAGDGLGV